MSEKAVEVPWRKVFRKTVTLNSYSDAGRLLLVGT